MCQIIITIRFSFATSTFAKRVGENYISWLYGSERMEERFELFDQLTLPSILHQTDLDHVTVQLVSSEIMPEKYKERLRQLVSRHTFIDTIFLKEISKQHHGLIPVVSSAVDRTGTRKTVVSTRLDDDDLLSRHYVRKVKEYARKKENHYKTLSFARGAVFELYSGRTSPRTSPMVSVGLCQISTNDRFKGIFEMGNHARILANGYPHIIDRSKMMYVLTDGQSNMTGRKVMIHRPRFSKKLLAEFPFLEKYRN